MDEHAEKDGRLGHPAESDASEASLEYEVPRLDLRLLEDAAKAFAAKSGMGNC
jgi:hypothetical protein